MLQAASPDSAAQANNTPHLPRPTRSTTPPPSPPPRPIHPHHPPTQRRRQRRRCACVCVRVCPQVVSPILETQQQFNEKLNETVFATPSHRVVCFAGLLMLWEIERKLNEPKVHAKLNVRETQKRKAQRTPSPTPSPPPRHTQLQLSTPHAATTLARPTLHAPHRRCFIDAATLHTLHTALPQLRRPTSSPTSPSTPTHHSPARASLPLTSNKHDRGKPDRCETSPAHLTSIALCSRAPDAVAWRCTPWPRPHGQGGLTNGSAATFEVELRAASPTCTSTARGKTAWARARPRARPRARAPSPPSAA